MSCCCGGWGGGPGGWRAVSLTWAEQCSGGRSFQAEAGSCEEDGGRTVRTASLFLSSHGPQPRPAPGSPGPPHKAAPARLTRQPGSWAYLGLDCTSRDHSHAITKLV